MVQCFYEVRVANDASHWSGTALVRPEGTFLSLFQCWSDCLCVYSIGPALV